MRKIQKETLRIYEEVKEEYKKNMFMKHELLYNKYMYEKYKYNFYLIIASDNYHTIGIKQMDEMIIECNKEIKRLKEFKKELMDEIISQME